MTDTATTVRCTMRKIGQYNIDSYRVTIPGGAASATVIYKTAWDAAELAQELSDAIRKASAQWDEDHKPR